jgi:hypothetical protein
MNNNYSLKLNVTNIYHYNIIEYIDLYLVLKFIIKRVIMKFTSLFTVFLDL